MGVIRWGSFAVFSACMAAFYIDSLTLVGAWIVVVIAAASAITFFWSFGAFTLEDIDEDHPDAVSRLDREDGIGRHKEDNR